MITLLENGEEKTESINNSFNDIDEAVEHYLEYDTSNFPINASKVTLHLSGDDDNGTVIFSKFKDNWYGSEYQFNFRGYFLNNLLYSVTGTEIDIANYIYKNIEKINNDCNLKLDIESFKSKIKPSDYIIEELIDEMSTGDATFELLDK